MALTDAARARLRQMWASLARMALADSLRGELSEDFRRLAAEASTWQSPLEHEADAFVLFGFGRIAKAAARSRVADLPRRWSMLHFVATEAAHLLADSPAAPPPRLPYAD